MPPSPLVILGQTGGWHVDQLKHAASAAGRQVVVATFPSLTAVDRTDGTSLLLNGVDLLESDGVLVRCIPPGSLEQIVFRMDALHRLEAAGVPVINPPRAVETCVDKYLATSRLRDAGLPVPPTMVCESLGPALAAFEELGGDVVVKPLFGSEGRGMVRIQDPAVAYRVLRAITSIDGVVYLQQYIDHPRYDVRVFVLGDRILGAMRRQSDGDFRTNVALGARFEEFSLPPAWADLALSAARAVGARIAGVDLLPDGDGNPMVLEVNSTPGFRALSTACSIDVAAKIIEYVTQEHGQGDGS